MSRGFIELNATLDRFVIYTLKNAYYQSHEELASAIRRYIRWRNKNAKNDEILKEQNKIKVA